MRKIIYTKPDGGIAVVSPVRNTIPYVETLTDAEIEQRAFDRLPPNAINPHFVLSVPQDRTFRDAWTSNGAEVLQEINKCREIHRAKLREMRLPKLAALDVEYMRADEDGDSAKKAEIAAKKRALRDVTNFSGIDEATTPDQLKLAIPEILK